MTLICAQLLLSLLSPWQWFCSTRTLSNSLEMVLTIIAMNFWPWKLYEGEPTAKAASGSPKTPDPETEIFQTTADVNK